MATVTEKRSPTAKLSESSRKVHDPLQRLRVYIRTYVVSEALIVLLVCLAVFFWVGLALDYGFFRLFGVDWVADLPRWIRAVLIATGLIGVGFFVEIGKLMRRLKHDPGHDAPIGSWLAHHPWAMPAAFGLFAACLYTGYVFIALFRDEIGGWVTGGIFAVLVLAFTSAIVVKRLLYEFGDVPLALVLEKRFPKLLGDRLITAVELNDPRAAAKYGYSSVMIEQTIHEAAQRVGQLNLKEVFDWKRLYLHGGLALLMTVGFFAATLGGMMGYASYKKQSVDFGQSLTALDDGAVVWAQRNILLDNERWPTRCLVVLLDFPKKGEPGREMKRGLGIEGEKEIAVDLKAKAIEFAIRDPKVAQCWRAATLGDLKRLGMSDIVALDKIPSSWEPRDASSGWTLDEIKQHLQRIKDGDKNLARPKESDEKDMWGMISSAEYLAGEARMSRTFRKLIVPESVTLAYVTEDGQKKSEATMTLGSNSDYTATLDKLSQTISLHLRAEDFRSDNYQIILVPPPRMKNLLSHEAHPAYLYHLAESPGRNRGDDPDRAFLQGLKQRRKPVQVDVVGSTKPRIEPPIGSDVTLQAETDKDLVSSTVELKSNSPALRNIRPTVTGKRTFEVTIPNVRTTLEFQFEFKDTDGAPGIQPVVIDPRLDESPDIRQFKPEVLRQVNNKYLITPSAVIPFSMDIKDDAGIFSIEYVYALSETPSPHEAARRAARVAAGIGLVIGVPDAPLSSQVYLRVLPATLEDRREKIEGRQILADFNARFNQQRIPKADTLKSLAEPQNLQRKIVNVYSLKELDQFDAYLKDHDLAIEDVPHLKGLDVSQIKRSESGIQVSLKAKDLEIQRQYDMAVQLEVLDTNIDKQERGRRTAPAGVPIQFTIISEVELLYEIGQEEQRLYDELFKSYVDLRKVQEQMRGIKFDLPLMPTAGKPVSFDSFSVRVEEIEKVLSEGRRILTKVHVDYDRILRELRTNRISNREFINKVKNSIVVPLRQIRDGDYLISEDGEKVRSGYSHALGSAATLRRTLDAKNQGEKLQLDDSRYYAEKAEKDLDRTIKALGDILAEMQGIVGRNEILKRLVKIEQRERELMQRLEEVRKQLEEDFFK